MKLNYTRTFLKFGFILTGTFIFIFFITSGVVNGYITTCGLIPSCGCVISSCGGSECGFCYGTRSVQYCEFDDDTGELLNTWSGTEECSRFSVEDFTHVWCDGDTDIGIAICENYICNSGVFSCVTDVSPPGGCCRNDSCTNDCGGGGGGGTPDFSMDMVQLSRTIEQGQSTIYDIIFTPSNNYSGIMNLSVSGCPSGDNCTLSPTSITFTNDSPNPGISAMTVTNTAGVAPGTYTLTVTGTDGTLTHSDTADLIVQVLPPPCATVPASVPAGQIFNALVRMFNNTGITWNSVAINPTNPHRLGSQTPTDNSRWGLGRVELPVNSVTPGQSVTFNFMPTAPSNPAGDSYCSSLGGGSYSCPFNWAMLQEGIAWYYGTLCTASITVTPTPTYTLTVTKSGTGTGTITSNPAGINCGTDCTENYTSGTSVTLTATSASGSTFAGWFGDCSGTGTCAVSMTQVKNVTATFNVSVSPPDFTFNSSNAIYATLIGSPSQTSNSTTITIIPSNGFNDNINLSVQSVSPALAGATYNFSDSTLTSSEYSSGSTFSVTLPSTTPAGTYTIIIRGADGGLIRTINVNLNVEVFSPGWMEI